MATYKAPLREMRFVLHEVLRSYDLAELPGFEEASPDQLDFLLEEMARICEDLLFPLNRPADEEGCHWKGGAVATPAGFTGAYATFTEAGWTALTADPEFGGAGLPKLLGFAMEEMVSAANLSFSTYPLLTAGAVNALARHGSPELRARFLPNMVQGVWSGTMCLTEPQCGTDLGLITTRAAPRDGGSYRIDGTKIFVTSGEHDLTENIIHLVLARLPGAPTGTHGISLFLVPKFLVGDEGAPAERNGVVCSSIEKKMGIQGSSTCVLNFEGAVGYLVGEPNRGVRCMFTMMNDARLGVGMQGLGLAQVAYHNAREYARIRLQGRALRGPAFPEQPADPLIVHPDVRRMLLRTKCMVEGMRALAYWVGYHLDLSEHHPDPAARQEGADLVALMTPIVKAFFTDQGFEAANLCVQIHGGHGYIRETGVEQYVRDSRIAQIWEGTNGVQALDLVGRKLPMHNGRLLRRFFHPVAEFLDAHADDPHLGELVALEAKAFGRLQQATATIAERSLRDPEEAGAVATDYLRLFALTAVGFMWLRMAEKARDRLVEAGALPGKIRGGGSSAGVPAATAIADPAPAIVSERNVAFYQAKLTTARFFFTKVLPETSGLLATIMTGAAPVMALDAADF